VLLSPVMPASSARIIESFGLDRDRELREEGLSWGRLKTGTETKRIPSLFPRIGTPKAKAGKGDGSRQGKETGGDGQGLIGIEDVQKLDLRVAEILSAERHPNADRLLKLTVRCDRERTIVAGIAEHFGPDELVGKKVIIVANLKPVRLRGVMSQGMLLVAKDRNGLHLLEVPSDTEPGSRVS